MGEISLNERKRFAKEAFRVSSEYDNAILIGTVMGILMTKRIFYPLDMEKTLIKKELFMGT